MTATTRLSPNFYQRMERFRSGLPDWDGEEIQPTTVERAIELARAALRVASEPFAAPAMDGSILLKWDFSRDLSVEFYVEDIETWDTVTVIESDVVKEAPISSERALLDLLRSLVPAYAGN